MRALRADMVKSNEELLSMTPELAVNVSKVSLQKEKIEELNDEIIRLRNENSEMNSQLTFANGLSSNLKGRIESSAKSSADFERKYMDAQHMIASLENH